MFTLTVNMYTKKFKYQKLPCGKPFEDTTVNL